MAEPIMPITEPERLDVETSGSPRIKIGKDGKRMIFIPAGSFLMGTSEAQIVGEILAKFLLGDPNEAETREIQAKFLFRTHEGDITDIWAKFRREQKEAETREILAKYLEKQGWLDRERPQHWVHLAAFYIAETPVANEEYKRFLDANSLHRVPCLWDKTRRTFPVGKDNHPVVDVSWQDANDYARWVGGRLPTEAEWEKAAGWDEVKRERRHFPWGMEFDQAKCNTWDSRIKDTTSIGNSEGKSPYLVMDMAGNVWEWTSSVWGKNPGKPHFKYPYHANDGREDLQSDALHVLRGGSWLSDPGLAHCAFRFRSYPCDRNINIGFRVAESVA